MTKGSSRDAMNLLFQFCPFRAKDCSLVIYPNQICYLNNCALAVAVKFHADLCLILFVICLVINANC